MTHHWPILFPIAGAAAFIIVIIWGTAKFNTPRARALRAVEATVPLQVVQERVLLVAPAHRITRAARADRHPFYVLIHVAVLGYAISIFLGSSPTNNVSSLSEATRFTMAACFIVGASIIIVGAAMGATILGWRFMPSVTNHLTSAVLGDDVTLPYRTGCAGMFAVCVSMCIYSVTSFGSTSGSLGGWMTGGCAVACMFLIPMLYRASRVFEKWDTLLITEAQSQLELDGYDSE